MNAPLLSVGLIGFGISARVFHLPLLDCDSRYQVTSVLSSQVEEIRSRVPSAQVVRSVPEMIATKPDLVLVTAPTRLHYELTKAVLEAGIHAVVEKPFVCSVAEGEELVALAQKKGVLLAVFHNRRWDNGFLTLKCLLSEGRIGTPYLYVARFDRIRPVVRAGRWRETPEEGGGVLLDLGSHLIDQALSLFGTPTLICADLERQRPDSQVEDYFELVLGFEKLRVRLQASSFVHGKFPHLELHGSDASYTKYGLDPQEGQARDGLTPHHSSWGIESPDAAGTLAISTDGKLEEQRIVSVQGCYQTFYVQLAEAILGGASVPVSGVEGLAVMRIIDQARGFAR